MSGVNDSEHTQDNGRETEIRPCKDTPDLQKMTFHELILFYSQLPTA